ncbi:MAG: methyltransferase domain-containing protein [Candidatus Woesearchaeota archaeon]|nr:methyltransferase domain-containing protein [Candidatus Woesearchaeota archaeon]
MPRILITKGKREYIPELQREVTVIKPKQYYVNDLAKDFGTSQGVIVKKDLKKKDGSKVKTNTNKEFVILTPNFSDLFKRLRKGPQSISIKDAGIIAGETSIGKESVVLEAGTGSGWLTCFLAHICQRVISYDIREDFQEIGKHNAKMLELDNITFKIGNVYERITEKNNDVIILDLPEPWRALENAIKAVKIGGWIVSYSPSVPQIQEFCNTASKKDSVLMGKTIEVIERLWKVEGQAVHPKSISIGHTAFLTFCRRII